MRMRSSDRIIQASSFLASIASEQRWRILSSRRRRYTSSPVPGAFEGYQYIRKESIKMRGEFVKAEVGSAWTGAGVLHGRHAFNGVISKMVPKPAPLSDIDAVP